VSLTFFPQETRASCTVACLRMVLAHWGIIADEATLRACCRTTKQGTRANDAITCAQKYGLQADELRDAQWADVRELLAAEIYPIALLNLYPLNMLWVMHAVVVESVAEETIVYLDPIYGRKSATVVSFDQAWAMNRRRAIVVCR